MSGKNGGGRQEKTRAIGGREIYRRIETARMALEQGFLHTRKEKKEILKARAQRLAAEPVKKWEAEDGIDVVEFTLAHERYAFVSKYVREVFPFTEFTPVPCTPAFVLGIINVHGQILSVLNVKKFFGIPEKGITNLNKAIILQSSDMEVGVLADSVAGMRNVPRRDLLPALPTLVGIGEEYLLGITKDRLIILDAEKLLADKGIIVHEQVDA